MFRSKLLGKVQSIQLQQQTSDDSENASVMQRHNVEQICFRMNTYRLSIASHLFFTRAVLSALYHGPNWHPLAQNTNMLTDMLFHV
jgi:hypothetical protein